MRMSMKKEQMLMALALLGLATGAEAVNVDFSGYMRAGTGINSAGGTQVCYGLPGADTKWRLGNECDYVIEPTFDAKIAEYEGSDWHMRVMPSVYRAWGDREFNTSGPGVTSSGTDELVTRFGQIYGYGNKIAVLANGRAWAGRRFYNRLQTGINDQFLENNDGDGAGVEDMEFGPARVSVAFMMNGRGPANDNRFQLPIRITNIPTLPSGDLAIYVTPSAQLKSRDQITGVTPESQPKGMAIGFYQTINGTFGGSTLIGLKGDKQGDVRNTRFIVQQNGSFGRTAWDLVGEYRLKTDRGVDNKWLALGGRIDTQIKGPLRFLTEIGHDQVRPEGEETRNMTKFTVALALSAGKEAGSRPTIRLFGTHAIWNEAARRAFPTNGVGGERLARVFGNEKSGTSFGVQVEAWW